MEGTHILAGIRYCQGAVADAIELIETALELARRTGFHYARGFQRTLLGRMHLAQGRREEAQAQFRIVLDTQTPDAQGLLWILRALAGLEAAYADPAAFQAYCRDILQQAPRARPTGAAPVVAGAGGAGYWLAERRAGESGAGYRTGALGLGRSVRRLCVYAGGRPDDPRRQLP